MQHTVNSLNFTIPAFLWTRSTVHAADMTSVSRQETRPMDKFLGLWDCPDVGQAGSGSKNYVMQFCDLRDAVFLNHANCFVSAPRLTTKCGNHVDEKSGTEISSWHSQQWLSTGCSVLPRDAVCPGDVSTIDQNSTAIMSAKLLVISTVLPPVLCTPAF